MQLVAALKYRYVTIGKMNLCFKGLAERSKNERPHRYIEPAERSELDKLLLDDIEMRLASRLLYDLAARSQDLPDLTFSSFIPLPDGSATVKWKPRKQRKKKTLRKCLVPAETMKIVKQFQGNKGSNDQLYPYTDNTMT